MLFCALVQSLCYSFALFVDEWESTTRHRVTLFMLYFVDLLFQASDALHVTAHFARPRGILVVVAQPSNHQTLHCTHHGWSHLLLHCATETTTVSIAVRIKRYHHVISHTFMWDHSVSMRTYVKHVLAYDDVSEQARKGSLCLVLLHTSHVLAVFSSSSLNLQTIKLFTAHIMVDLTYCCTALQKPQLYL